MTFCSISFPVSLASACCSRLCYGASNGILTIARGTVPAELFGTQQQGALLGALARPSFFAKALAPALFAAGLSARILPALRSCATGDRLCEWVGVLRAGHATVASAHRCSSISNALPCLKAASRKRSAVPLRTRLQLRFAVTITADDVDRRKSAARRSEVRRLALVESRRHELNLSGVDVTAHIHFEDFLAGEQLTATAHWAA